MKKFIIAIFLVLNLSAADNNDKLFDCTEIFKARKSELLIELERIDEQKQSLSALKSATEELLNKREQKISQDEATVEKKLSEVSTKESNIKKMLEKNEQILKEIKELKAGKVAQSFSKMKPQNAASVLSEMQPQEAVDILSTLKADAVSKILAKMEPKKASEISSLLSKLNQ